MQRAGLTAYADGDDLSAHSHATKPRKPVSGRSFTGGILQKCALGFMLVGAAMAAPLCPVIRNAARKRDASRKLSFSTGEIVEVDTNYCSFPKTRGRSVRDISPIRDDPPSFDPNTDDSLTECEQINNWRNDSVDQYLTSDEKQFKRRFENYLATADSVRKARELQVDLGAHRNSFQFPVV